MGWLRKVLFYSFVIGGLVMGVCRPAFGSAWDSWIIPPGLPPEIGSTLNDLKNVAKEEAGQTLFAPTYIIYKDTEKIYAIPSQESGLPYLEETDDATLIQEVIDTLYNNDIGGIIFFKPGCYNIYTMINFKCKKRLWVIADSGAKFVAYTEFSSLFRFYNPTSTEVEWFILENIKTETNSTDVTFLNLNNENASLILKNCYFQGGNIVIGMTDTSFLGIYDTYIKPDEYGTAITTGGQINRLHMNNCKIEIDDTPFIYFFLTFGAQGFYSIENSTLCGLGTLKIGGDENSYNKIIFKNCDFNMFLNINPLSGLSGTREVNLSFINCDFLEASDPSDKIEFNFTNLKGQLLFENCKTEYPIEISCNKTSVLSMVKINNLKNDTSLKFPAYPTVDYQSSTPETDARETIIYDNKFAIGVIDIGDAESNPETFYIARIPAKSKIKRVMTYCETGFDGTTTINIGISGNTDGFLANANIGKTAGDFSGSEDDELGDLLWDGTNNHKREYWNDSEYSIIAEVNNTDSTQGKLIVIVEFDEVAPY